MFVFVFRVSVCICVCVCVCEWSCLCEFTLVSGPGLGWRYTATSGPRTKPRNACAGVHPLMHTLGVSSTRGHLRASLISCFYQFGRAEHDSLAEWSKALASGASPQGRGFEPHSCHWHVSSKHNSRTLYSSTHVLAEGLGLVPGYLCMAPCHM